MGKSSESKKRPGCLGRMLRWFLYLVLGLVALIIGMAILQPGGESVGILPTQTPSSTNALVPTETEVPMDNAMPTLTPAEPTTAPAAVNDEITFGEPLLLRQPGLTLVSLLVTNNSPQVKTFTAQATFKVGDQIAVVASGAVNDLLPGQTRAMTLLPMGEIPESYDSVRVNVDTMVIEADQTDGGNAAQKISFGPPVAMLSPGFNMINVEATNMDSVPHTFLVQAALLRNGQLVGYANGAVNDLGPGEVKTATLIVQGELNDAEIKVAVETMTR